MNCKGGKHILYLRAIGREMVKKEKELKERFLKYSVLCQYRLQEHKGIIKCNHPITIAKIKRSQALGLSKLSCTIAGCYFVNNPGPSHRGGQ